MSDTRSKELYERAKVHIPGGVNSPVRAFRAVNRTPRFMESAKGDRIIDADGNEYIDYVCSWGPGILGHAHPQVIQKVMESCKNGLTFGAPTEKEVILAELISELIPSMEVSRLVSSGTEAVMSAIRAARGFTGRDKIIKFRGCYHGHSDSLLVKAGSGALTTSVPDSAGVPKDDTKNTLVAEYNDKDSVEKLFKENKNEIAAIIVEPVAANMGLVLPEEGFLEFLREITKDHDSLLIFDEVITGFRLSLGGAQQYYNIKPDITTLGKIVGGGMPIGAICATAEVAKAFTPGSHGTTFGGHPVSCAAALAEVNELIDRDLAGNAKKVGDYFAEKLKGLPHVKEVRHQGLLTGIEFDDTLNAVDIKHACFDRKLLVTAIGRSVIRTIPPLIVTEEECDKAFAIMKEAVESLA
mgnify:CR=1 FL=1